MPIGVRTSDLPPASGPTDGAVFSGPPDVLLHSGGPASPPGQALALDAVRLARLLAVRSRHPARWQSPSFRREVDLVRAHLTPIRTRASLAALVRREAFHGRPPAGTDHALGDSAVRVAYAIRWLELGDGSERPAWREWLRAAG
jgi:hypothetical protein